MVKSFFLIPLLHPFFLAKYYLKLLGLPENFASIDYVPIDSNSIDSASMTSDSIDLVSMDSDSIDWDSVDLDCF